MRRQSIPRFTYPACGLGWIIIRMAVYGLLYRHFYAGFRNNLPSGYKTMVFLRCCAAPFHICLFMSWGILFKLLTLPLSKPMWKPHLVKHVVRDRGRKSLESQVFIQCHFFSHEPFSFNVLFSDMELDASARRLRKYQPRYPPPTSARPGTGRIRYPERYLFEYLLHAEQRWGKI